MMMLVVPVNAGWSSLQNLVEASGAGVSGAAVAGNCITNLFLYIMYEYKSKEK